MPATDRLFARFAPLGSTLLRVVIGLVFFMHGYQKVFENGVGATGDGFAALGIPMPYVMGVFVPLLELVGGLMLVAGLATRLLGVLFTGVSVVAAVTVHADGGFFAQSGGYEYLLVLAVCSLALVVSGPGLFALDGLFRGNADALASDPASDRMATRPAPPHPSLRATVSRR